MKDAGPRLRYLEQDNIQDRRKQWDPGGRMGEGDIVGQARWGNKGEEGVRGSTRSLAWVMGWWSGSGSGGGGEVGEMMSLGC